MGSLAARLQVAPGVGGWAGAPVGWGAQAAMQMTMQQMQVIASSLLSRRGRATALTLRHTNAPSASPSSRRVLRISTLI